METCFVIQPFDNGKFDKRYRDTFRPAIEECGLMAYRVDEDISSNILIENIEKGIREARIVLAEITLDNPNVWYELGYAMANNKDIIMVCSIDERTNAYPFDIRHRNIIQYSTGSLSDYSKLEDDIKNKIKYFLHNESNKKNTINSLEDNNINDFSNKEIALIASMMSLQYTNEGEVSEYYLTDQMNRYGYNQLNTSFAIRRLKACDMLISKINSDMNGNEYTNFKLTDKGEEWALMNEQRFNQLEEVNRGKGKVKIDDGDMPF